MQLPSHLFGCKHSWPRPCLRLRLSFEDSLINFNMTLQTHRCRSAPRLRLRLRVRLLGFLGVRYEVLSIGLEG